MSEHLDSAQHGDPGDEVPEFHRPAARVSPRGVTSLRCADVFEHGELVRTIALGDLPRLDGQPTNVDRSRRNECSPLERKSKHVEERGWLVERPGFEGAVMWWAPQLRGIGWSRNLKFAIRFATREDAEKAISYLRRDYEGTGADPPQMEATGA